MDRPTVKRGCVVYYNDPPPQWYKVIKIGNGFIQLQRNNIFITKKVTEVLPHLSFPNEVNVIPDLTVRILEKEHYCYYEKKALCWISVKINQITNAKVEAILSNAIIYEFDLNYCERYFVPIGNINEDDIFTNTIGSPISTKYSKEELYKKNMDGRKWCIQCGKDLTEQVYNMRKIRFCPDCES